jgi:hypothetical protein
MKKTFILLSFILCAGFSAAAQTGGDTAASTRRASYRNERTVTASPRVVRVGPRTTYLKEGLSTEDVIRLLGRPAEVSERQEGGAKVVSYVFQRGEGRVLVAEFVADRLVRSRVEPRGEGLRAEYVNF